MLTILYLSYKILLRVNKLTKCFNHLCTFNLNMVWIYEFTRLSESLGSLKWLKRKLKYFKLHLYSHRKPQTNWNQMSCEPPQFPFWPRAVATSLFCSTLFLKKKKSFMLSTSSSLVVLSFLLWVTEPGCWEDAGQT